jgi:hypothetical protein
MLSFLKIKINKKSNEALYFTEKHNTEAEP